MIRINFALYVCEAVAQSARSSSEDHLVSARAGQRSRFPTNSIRKPMDLSLRDVSPVSVQIRDLTVQFKTSLSAWNRATNFLQPTKEGTGFKIILDGVSADMPAGSLTAIIGGSGSGKTTLLNTISHRVSSKKLKVSGTTTYNGNEELRTVRSSYVMQQDVLLSTLTVRETLQYAADLRLPPPSTKEERKAAVDRVILELGLKECADTRIGNNIHKGCSGGEKRRTSIGVQMLANPSVLFCDEPTTGLDAYSAFQIVQTLKKLAETGRTIILSIHTPRSEIWKLFDRVILLSRGATLYSGPADAAAPHFQKCGYELPPFVNPAEFLIDLAAIDSRSEDAERASYARVSELKEAWQDHDKSRPDEKLLDDDMGSCPMTPILAQGPAGGATQGHRNVGLRRQLSVLTRRTTKVTVRDPMGVAGSLFEAVIMSILTGWIFWQLGDDLAGIRSREGALYTASSLQGYLILMFETYRLTIDIQLFDRERNEDVVSVSAFLLSRRASRLFLEDLPVPIIFSIIYYFMAGFREDARTFFVFLTVMVIGQFITVTLASLCVAVSRDFAGASLIANLAYTLQSFCCGYFVQAQQIPVYVRWLKWVTYNFYMFGALTANEFIGVDGGYYGQLYACPHSRDPRDPACQQYVGRYIMESLGLPSNWLWRPILLAASFAIAFFFGAGLVLTFWKVDIGVLQARKKEEDTSHGKENSNSRPSQEIRRVAISLDRYRLDVQKRHLWKRNYSKAILNPVTASFEPGKINVIMGPSGSGKTSLLQGLAQRLNSTLFSDYCSSGNITLNGAIPSAGVIESVASFVTQDDDVLMSSLTVRETLRFAAGLRLPSWMSKREKHRRAEDVILRMGLKDCADNMIGSELKKGISGGEKRRVSIAIQVLTDPKVLLLDEPTSGLDAFTATSVIDVLNILAEEGRTIVMTIHQARSDVFKSFHNILLLTQGGSLVYSGKGQAMLPHFQTLGYECPRATNPADFVLDLITVNLQQEDREAASREKVQLIIQEWQTVQQRQQRQHEQQVSGTSKIATPAELSSLRRQMNSFRVTFPLVLKRSAINIRRTPEILLARTMQVVGISIIFMLFFAPLQSNAEAVQSRMGFVQEVAALYFVGMLQNLAVYPIERDMFYREHADGCYTVSTFLFSYTLLEVPFTVLSSLTFGALASYAANLKRTPIFFLIASLNSFCVVSCGESIGIMFCTIFSSHEGFALNVTSVLLTISTVMGGVMSLNIPGVLQALNHLSPLKYQVANMAAYSMHGQKFSCSPTQEVDGQCPISSGEQVLKLYNLDKDAGMNLMALGVIALAYRMIALAVLKVARMRWDFEILGRKRKQDEGNS
ncbi:hypothetical protein FGG08_006533 [Glutinoglossum americanum]|uniref:ABC transporter domain-containing protein n=1 Tax=Glutinoglossum americanum TaxID=1670608 RepID=A0A9P8I391_9PEZI|nr:hypothetical protein FGG08_006533 [Glutinoglossum americanum]